MELARDIKEDHLGCLVFTDETVQKLFGHEAAEDESTDRLREYYLKSRVYEKMTGDVPFGVLVGRKGTGKSALFHVAIAEDIEKGDLSILLRPEDFEPSPENGRPINKSAREWKESLVRTIRDKTLYSLTADIPGNEGAIRDEEGNFVSFIADTAKSYLESKIKLNSPQKTAIRNFLKSGRITVYIDDLDPGKKGRPEEIRSISSLLCAARELCSENQGLRFRVALKADVYYLLRTSDRSTDKLDTAVTWLSWTNHEILVMLIKRIETFFGRSINENAFLKRRPHEIAHYLNTIMDSHFAGEGYWEDAPVHKVLLSLIRKRPGDLVTLCSLAARRACGRNSSRIETDDFASVLDEYAQGRLYSTIREYRTELPDIKRLLADMRPNRRERRSGAGYIYTPELLVEKIQKIAEQGKFMFSDQTVASAAQLAQFLYKINFLTARNELNDHTVERKYFEESRYIQGESPDPVYALEIHPAYQWALRHEETASIFHRLELSDDDR